MNIITWDIDVCFPYLIMVEFSVPVMVINFFLQTLKEHLKIKIFNIYL